MDDEPLTGPRNMALDHALAESVDDGAGVLRFYSWSPHAISFGRNEPTAGRYDLEAARRAGLTFVRRPTGGRALLHAHEVTYAVVLPVRALGRVRTAYEMINRGLVDGLATLGIPVELSRDGPVLPVGAGPCFRAPAPGEVVAGGRKLVGSAQVRIGSSLLQHGSVILRGDQSAVARLSGDPGAAEPPATVEGELGRTVDPRDVVAALATGLRLALGGRWAEGDYLPEERGRADALVVARYGCEPWTWRR